MARAGTCHTSMDSLRSEVIGTFQPPADAPVFHEVTMRQVQHDGGRFIKQEHEQSSILLCPVGWPDTLESSPTPDTAPVLGHIA
eukprot:360946-Chlamydomonas_euryale.AAC.12